MRELRVLIDRVPAGTLVRQDNRRLHFEYDEGYQQRTGPTPLSVSMPVEQRAHTHAVVDPWLAGLLPDNPDVLRRWAREFGLGDTEPFSLQATPIGEDCAGGVQFVRPERLDGLLNDPGSVAWLSDEDLAERIRDMRRDVTAWRGETTDPERPRFTGQFSLAGRQAKTALLFENERWGVPSGRIPTTHIIKPPIPDLYDQELVEHLCLDAAREAGLVAAHSRVLTVGGESAIVITRYDRRDFGDGQGIVRVHQEDMCQALSVPPDRKYQDQGGPGPTEIAALLRRVMPRQLAEEEVWRFVDALIFNWIIAGTDAHAKNYSLLLLGSAVRLAPLYDVTSILPFENERHMRLAMKVGDDYALYNHRNPWPKAAPRMALDADQLDARVLDLCERVPAAFERASAKREVVALERWTPAHLTELVARRAERCARLLRSTSSTPAESAT